MTRALAMLGAGFCAAIVVVLLLGMRRAESETVAASDELRTCVLARERDVVLYAEAVGELRVYRELLGVARDLREARK